MRDALRRDLIAKKVIDQEVTSKITVSEQEINDYYEANKAQFNLQRKRSGSHRSS